MLRRSTVMVLAAGLVPWAPGRDGLVAGIMGCMDSLMGTRLVCMIEWISNTGGFGAPFRMISGLVAAGTLPVALARWEPLPAQEERTA